MAQNYRPHARIEVTEVTNFILVEEILHKLQPPAEKGSLRHIVSSRVNLGGRKPPRFGRRAQALHSAWDATHALPEPTLGVSWLHLPWL